VILRDRFTERAGFAVIGLALAQLRGDDQVLGLVQLSGGDRLGR
jgi:hypothetical protein